MEDKQEITLTAQSDNTAVVNSANEYIANFRQSYALAKILCRSQLIPQQYQNRADDVCVAIDMAQRMGVSPLMVMQNLYVVKGKPSWSGQACMSFIKARYSNVMPIYVGTPNTDSRGCYISAELLDGTKVNGTTVTIKMAKDEGWYGKNGSKWQTMPEQMLAYRAAAFFARVFCPETLMGIQTEGEVEDSEPPSSRAEQLTAAVLGENSGLLEDK